MSGIDGLTVRVPLERLVARENSVVKLDDVAMSSDASLISTNTTPVDDIESFSALQKLKIASHYSEEEYRLAAKDKMAVLKNDVNELLYSKYMRSACEWTHNGWTIRGKKNYVDLTTVLDDHPLRFRCPYDFKKDIILTYDTWIDLSVKRDLNQVGPSDEGIRGFWGFIAMTAGAGAATAKLFSVLGCSTDDAIMHGLEGALGVPVLLGVGYLCARSNARKHMSIHDLPDSTMDEKTRHVIMLKAAEIPSVLSQRYDEHIAQEKEQYEKRIARNAMRAKQLS